MTDYKYSTTIGEKDAPAVGRALPISTKQSIEICSYIRGKRLERAKDMLTNAINEIVPVPFKRFTDGVGHKRGKIANGRFPKNACKKILALLNSAQANAQSKGLSSSDLVLRHISAQKGANTPRYGRMRRFAKRTTIEVVLTETEGAKKEKKPVEKKKNEENKEQIKPAEEKKSETSEQKKEDKEKSESKKETKEELEQEKKEKPSEKEESKKKEVQKDESKEKPKENKQ